MKTSSYDRIEKIISSYQILSRSLLVSQQLQRRERLLDRKRFPAIFACVNRMPDNAKVDSLKINIKTLINTITYHLLKLANNSIALAIQAPGKSKRRPLKIIGMTKMTLTKFGNGLMPVVPRRSSGSPSWADHARAAVQIVRSLCPVVNDISPRTRTLLSKRQRLK